MSQMTFFTEVPAGHAVRRALEGALREGSLRLLGQWTFSLRDARGGGWWLLRVEGPGFSRTLIVEPAEQRPVDILKRLEECLRDAGVTFKVPARLPSEDRSLTDLFDTWLPPGSVPTPARNAD